MPRRNDHVRNSTTSWRAALAVGAGALAVAASGCGGTTTGATSTKTKGDASRHLATASGRTFASLRATWSPPDSMDPGIAYTTQAWQVMWNVWLGLVTYQRAAGTAGATLIPALAQAMPTITDGGKTYSFTLRPGLRYSDGTPVHASDFRSTIERDFRLDSPGVGFFSGIVGADRFASTRTGHITGIVSDDAARTITIHLTAPRGDFLNILATEFAALVPASTPASDRSAHPIPATGPYMLTSYAANREFTLERNPHYRPIAGVPTGNPDRVDATIVEDDSRALDTVLLGHSDYDEHTIPVDQLADIQSKHASQLRFYTQANTYYFFMNQRTAPFDKLAVRQAVNYAIDRTALVKIFGGLAIPAQNFLPPTYPSFKQIGRYGYDLAKARALVRSAGATGAKVTVWGYDSDHASKSVQYLQDQLNKIGLDAKVKIVSRGVYQQVIGDQASKAQIGYTNWYQDYPNPIDWFDVLLNGDRITQVHNNNPGNVDDSVVNHGIAALKRQPQLTPAVNGHWAALDKRVVVEDAAVAPFLNEESTDLFSSRVDTSCYVNNVLYSFDFAQICVK
jgi:peptide/nickel transport system substrate-binding protein